MYTTWVIGALGQEQDSVACAVERSLHSQTNKQTNKQGNKGQNQVRVACRRHHLRTFGSQAAAHASHGQPTATTLAVSWDAKGKGRRSNSRSAQKGL